MQSNHPSLHFTQGTYALNLQLLRALEQLDYLQVQEALNAGADINMHMGALGLTPLMYCARNIGFDPSQDERRQRQLHLDLITLLIARGAKLNAVSAQGNSALHYALATEFDLAAQHLMRAGASLNHVNHKGIKAMDLCNSVSTPSAFDYMMRNVLHMDDTAWDDWTDQLE